MRSNSYFGFVILLQMLYNNPNSLQGQEITFLMPNDTELSRIIITPNHLEEFLLSHSIPTALPINNLLHLPTGTVLPSSVKNRTIAITNRGRANFLVNNARLVSPNVCSSVLIRCHGITNVMSFGNPAAFSASEANPPTTSIGISEIKTRQLGSSPSFIGPLGAPPRMK
ncbi:hypothetical protein GIB67_013406 [Kingdonia uniflora]|uniref:FAS1 domain-containing protein n=1 Tax=Kingdonia uniflora TaxID=39325 RepID=A0A7J7LQY2_9MAGN|nr:hypothetical protein GIB67_013406 [Kingdonia uniflora]